MGTEQLTPTTAANWQGKVSTEGAALPLPSGNVALVRPLSPQAFLTSGMIPDPLLSMIRKSIHEKKGLNPAALNKMLDDVNQLADAMMLIDRAVCFSVVEPEIVMPPPCNVDDCGEYAHDKVHQTPALSGHHMYQEGVRKEDTLYADQVTLEDKMFVFQWCLGGTRDLEKFHSEQETTVGSLSDGQTTKRAAKRPARRK